MQIKLRLGSGYNPEHTIKNISDQLKHDDTTLKDVAIILKYMCGKGTKECLAHEIAFALHYPYKVVLETLNEIIENYISMSDEKAQIRTTGHPKQDTHKMRGIR